MVAMQQPAAAVVLVCVAEGHVGQHNHWWRGRRHLHLKHSLQSKRQLWSVIGYTSCPATQGCSRHAT
jgi:hypothetical protein